VFEAEHVLIGAHVLHDVGDDDGVEVV